jgi:hypothetical protein
MRHRLLLIEVAIYFRMCRLTDAFPTVLTRSGANSGLG